MLPAGLRARITGPGAVLPGAAGHAAPLAPPIHPLHPSKIAFMTSKTHARVDKARRVRGFTPRFDFARGIDLTAAWAEWANLL